MGGEENKEEPTKPIEEFKKPQAAQIGVNAERSCTNLCGFVFFVLVWVGFIAFAGVAFSHGNTKKLVYGVDYTGSICSQADYVTDRVSDAAKANWTSRKYLFYPVGFNSKTGAFIVKDAKNLGVCVSSCPKQGERRYTYNKNASVGKGIPDSYYSWFDTTPKFHRCVPQILNFNCSKQASSGGNGTAIAACNRNKGSSSSLFDTLAGFGDVAQRGFSDVVNKWWVVLVCALITIIVSFAWLWVLNKAVKPVVLLTILLVFVTIGVIGGLAQKEWMRIKDLPNGDEGMIRTYLAVFICCYVALFLLLCVCIYLRHSILVAIDIVEEAAQVPLAIKTMLVVPPVLVLIIIPIAIFFMFVAANVYTASSSITLDTPQLNTNGDRNGTNVVSVQAVQYDNWRPFGYVFTLFHFLWNFAFVSAIGYMITAFCGVFWYWSKPGSPKAPEHGVLKALSLVLHYHIGTAALGSLLVAIIQIIRIMVAWMEKHMEKYSKNSDAVKCVLCCVNCCLACFEKIIKFISRNAYIMQAMTGEPFMTAARHAMSLLGKHIAVVVGVNVISEYVILLSNIIITGISLGIAYGILSGMDDFSSAGFIFIAIIIGVISFGIAATFMSVTGICCDVVCLCYFLDLEINDGQNRPYFFPDDLAQHFDKVKAKMKENSGDGENQKFTGAETNYKEVEK